MQGSPVGALYIELLADASKMNKALTAAGYDVTKLESRSKQSLGRMDSTFSSRFASMGRSAAQFATVAAGVGTAIGAGMTAGLAVTRNAAKAILEVGDAAKRAGVSVESFSELRFVAERNRVDIDALTDGLKELQLRADEYIVTGAGSAKESFERLGYSAEELNEKLKDPSALFTEIIGKIGKLEKAAQIRVADELFGGTGGEKFVQLIEQGEQGIRDTIQAGRDLGVVLNDDLVTKAGELENAFNDVTAAVSSGLHQSIVNAGWALYDFLQQFQAVESRTTASLENKLRELGKRRVEIEYQILQGEADVRNFTGADASLAMLKHNVAMLKEEMAALAEEEYPIVMALDARTPITPPSASVVPTVPGSGISSSAKATREETDAVTAHILALRDELDLIGKSEVQKRIVNELRAAGVDLASDEGQAIAALVTQIEAENSAQQALQDAIETTSSLTKDFIGGIISDLRSGVSATEALSNAFGRLGDRLLDMALDSPIAARFTMLKGKAA